MICKVQGKRFVYKFVCDLKTLIGYSAAELNRLVTECEQKKLAKMQLHGIAQPVTAVALAAASLQAEKDNWAQRPLGLRGLLLTARASIALTFITKFEPSFISRLYSLMHDFFYKYFILLWIWIFLLWAYILEYVYVKVHHNGFSMKAVHCGIVC